MIVLDTGTPTRSKSFDNNSILPRKAALSFLTLSKNFSNPVSQISQQINSVVMALAGARRVFSLMDEAPEEDRGYVSLVQAAHRAGQLTESEGRITCGLGNKWMKKATCG